MYIPKEIDTLMPLSKEHLVWMQIQAEIVQQEITNERQSVFEFVTIAREQYEVVGVAEIILDAEFSLHVLVDMERQNIPFEMFREYEHIFFAHLSFLEFAPCREQIFFRDDMLKDTRMNLPPPILPSRLCFIR